MTENQRSLRSSEFFLTDIDDQKKSIKTVNMKHTSKNEEMVTLLGKQENDVRPKIHRHCDALEKEDNNDGNLRCDSIINTEIDEKNLLKKQSKFDWIYSNQVNTQDTRSTKAQSYNNNQATPPDYVLCESNIMQDEALLRNYQNFYEQNGQHYNHNPYYNNNYGVQQNYQDYNVPYYYGHYKNSSKFKQPPAQTEERQAFDPMVFYTEDSEVERRYMKKYKLKTNLKPPYSYSQLITKAIEESENGILTLSEIYKYIKESFEYYNKADNTWQNSIRHNLSLNKVFKKVARPSNKPGKGGYWTIDYDYIANGTPYKRYRRRSDPQSYDNDNSNTTANNKQYKDCTINRERQDIECSSDSEKNVSNRM